jgi:hypothetical protein
MFHSTSATPATSERILVYHPGVGIQSALGCPLLCFIVPEGAQPLVERHMGDMEGRLEGLLILANGERKDIREPESPKVVTERAMVWWNKTIVVGTTTSTSCVLIVSYGGWLVGTDYLRRSLKAIRLL